MKKILLLFVLTSSFQVFSCDKANYNKDATVRQEVSITKDNHVTERSAGNELNIVSEFLTPVETQLAGLIEDDIDFQNLVDLYLTHISDLSKSERADLKIQLDEKAQFIEDKPYMNGYTELEIFHAINLAVYDRLVSTGVIAAFEVDTDNDDCCHDALQHYQSCKDDAVVKNSLMVVGTITLVLVGIAIVGFTGGVAGTIVAGSSTVIEWGGLAATLTGINLAAELEICRIHYDVERAPCPCQCDFTNCD